MKERFPNAENCLLCQTIVKNMKKHAQTKTHKKKTAHSAPLIDHQPTAVGNGASSDQDEGTLDVPESLMRNHLNAWFGAEPSDIAGKIMSEMLQPFSEQPIAEPVVATTNEVQWIVPATGSDVGSFIMRVRNLYSRVKENIQWGKLKSCKAIECLNAYIVSTMAVYLRLYYMLNHLMSSAVCTEWRF